MLRSMNTLHRQEQAEDGLATSPHSRASLRHLATTAGGYGSAELTPEFLPGPARQATLKQQQLAKAVEHIATATAPTMASLAASLKVSRATAYRVVGMPEFQGMLRQVLTGRLAMSVQKAFGVVEQTMETGSPSLRLRAAQFLIERHDKLSAVAGAEPAKTSLENEKNLADLFSDLTLGRVRREIEGMLPEHLSPEMEMVRIHVFKALTPKRPPKPEDELVDVALEDEDGYASEFPNLTG